MRRLRHPDDLPASFFDEDSEPEPEQRVFQPPHDFDCPECHPRADPSPWFLMFLGAAALAGALAYLKTIK